jgi:hypothetical protein
MKFLCELFDKEQFYYSELKVKQYKELLKCSFGDELDIKIFFETITEIFENLTGKSASFFKEQISILDMLCLLLDVRNTCFDSVCRVTLTNEDKQINLDLRLDYIREELIELHKIAQNKIILDSNFQIILNYPSVQRLLDKDMEDYLPFISEIWVMNSNDEAKLLLEKVSPKIFFAITEQYKLLIDEALNYNFLSRYKIKQNMSFVPNVETFIWFTKLIFNESLQLFYDNLFSLA